MLFKWIEISLALAEEVYCLLDFVDLQMPCSKLSYVRKMY